MGRYIERAENFARYSKEIYFSSLDAPIIESYNRNFVLESMLYMTGIFDMKDVCERDVLFKIGMDTDNPNSIVSILTMARENARSARNAISLELWESINKYYHFVNTYPVETYLSSGFYEFTQTILEQTSILRGKIYATLLHDEVWSVILLGVYIERVLQLIRIINSKLHDIFKIEQTVRSNTDMSFEWTTLLRCAEAFDMNRKYYGSIPNRKQVIEFLLLNEQCPRSVHHSLLGIKRYVELLSKENSSMPGTIGFNIGKICAEYKFLTFEDFSDNVYDMLNSTQQKLVAISDELERRYLSF